MISTYTSSMHDSPGSSYLSNNTLKVVVLCFFKYIEHVKIVSNNESSNARPIRWIGSCTGVGSHTKKAAVSNNATHILPPPAARPSSPTRGRHRLPVQSSLWRCTGGFFEVLYRRQVNFYRSCVRHE